MKCCPKWLKIKAIEKKLIISVFSDNVDLDSAEVRNHLETLVESLIGEGLDDSSILKPNKSNVPQAGEVTIYSSIYIFFNGYLQVFLSI